MGKFNRVKKLFERTSIESSEAHPEPTEPVSPELQGQDMIPAGDGQEEVPEASSSSAQSATEDVRGEASPTESKPLEEGASSTSEEPSESTRDREMAEEDALEDVRRALIEEDADEDQKKSRWWHRVGRRGKKAVAEQAPAEMDLPAAPESAAATEMPRQKQEGPEDSDELEDLIDLLAAESPATTIEPSAPFEESATEPEPESRISFDELKKQAFERRAGEEQEEISDVRSIALEGGEEVLVEVETTPVNPVEERLNSFENALKPYRRYIYAALALLGAAIAVTAVLILFNVYQRSRPEPVREVPNLPYPTGVALPGGWRFELGRGALENGSWNPRGPEWLEGTEVCRWVSLPWSTQLEAVVRTLNPEDPIELFMSNNERLVYGVYSIRELNRQEMQTLDTNSPCLLLILTRADSENRWVVTALP